MNRDSIGIIIQARMASTRLPGKVMKAFYQGKTILEVLLETLHKIDGIKIIVAISDNPSDDCLFSFLKQKKELVFRGPENDVLKRFVQAAEYYGLKGIIRICSDNPFIDYDGIKKLISAATDSFADYIGYKVNDIPSIKTHFGFWGEYVSVNALKRVLLANDASSSDHEHVTIYVYSHPESFVCEWLSVPIALSGRNDIRLTIDTDVDFNNASKIFGILKNISDNFSLSDIVNVLDGNNDIRQSMVNSILMNKK